MNNLGSLETLGADPASPSEGTFDKIIGTINKVTGTASQVNQMVTSYGKPIPQPPAQTTDWGKVALYGALIAGGLYVMSKKRKR